MGTSTPKAAEKSLPEFLSDYGNAKSHWGVVPPDRKAFDALGGSARPCLLFTEQQSPHRAFRIAFPRPSFEEPRGHQRQAGNLLTGDEH